MPTSISEGIYQRILEKLMTGEITPGEQLVNRALAKELGASAIPVREALQRLASEGLVEHIPGAGMYVHQLDAGEVAQLYSFREQLECYAASEAARHARGHQLQRLNGTLKKARALLKEVQEKGSGAVSKDYAARWIRLDAEFHGIVIEAAGNVWLTRAASQIQLLHNIIRSKSGDFEITAAKNTLKDHRAIADAISRGEGEKAAKTMSQHIRSARQYSLESLDM